MPSRPGRHSYAIAFAVVISENVARLVLPLFLIQVYGSAAADQFVYLIEITLFLGAISLLGIDSILLKSARKAKKTGSGALRRLLKQSTVRVICSSVLVGSIYFLVTSSISKVNVCLTTLLSLVAVVLAALFYSLSFFIQSASNQNLGKFLRSVLPPALVPVIGMASLSRGSISQSYFVEVVILVLLICTFISIAILAFSSTDLRSGPNRILTDFSFRNRMNFVMVSANLLLLTKSDVIMIKTMVDASGLSEFVVAAGLANTILLGHFAANIILVPLLSDADSRSDHFISEAQMQKTSLFSTVIGGVVFLFVVTILAFVDLPIDIDQLSILVLFSVLSIGSFANAATGPCGFALTMRGDQAHASKISLSVTVLNIAFNLLLIPLLGVLGAAISTALSLLMLNVLFLLQLKKKQAIWSSFIRIAR